MYIVSSISEFHENLSNDSNNDPTYSDEEALKICEDYFNELPLDKIYISDPRFRNIYIKYLPKVDEDLTDTPSWQDVFLLGDFDNNNSKIGAIKEIDACLKNLNNLTLEDQMSDFFIQFFKNSTNNLGFLDRKIRNFNIKVFRAII